MVGTQRDAILKVYNEFINQLESDVALTEEALRKIKNKYRSPNSDDLLNLYMSAVTGLDQEFQSLYGSYSMLMHKVSTNKFIRTKRAWFGLGSDILRTVFGVARDSDIQSIKSVLATLHQKQ